MFGKWDLGHYSPQFLPTARGFDYFVGYVSSSAYYWSKKDVFFPKYQDLLASDSDCYQPYLWDDKHEYSTWMYRDKAIRAIEAHNKADPMFMYISLTAVHNPFGDLENHFDGLTESDVGYDAWNQVQNNVIGGNRKQYAMSLYLMDSAVSDVYEALENKGIADFTFIIFASDNGGCFTSGGKNGPLRGTKGSLYEGGVKVDSFLYNAKLPKGVEGSTYSGLMHVSDWFPTILDLAGIHYKPDDDYKLDGVSQKIGFKYGESSNPRDFMLYNY
jgi:arylsulfatase B/arylsulfatase I/J